MSFETYSWLVSFCETNLLANLCSFNSCPPTGQHLWHGKSCLALSGTTEIFVLDTASSVMLWSPMLQLAAWELQSTGQFISR